ncbi:MAG: hypothetical protein HS115_09930 [Spirochaetales bacterium]|nr:hypothetical protein [Spirochaetales bacterium]
MNALHAHLALNHFPIVLAVLLIAVAFVAIVLEAREWRVAAASLAILVGLTAGLAVYTGEQGEDLTREMAGFTRELVESHEAAAKQALYLCLLIGALGAGGLFIPDGRLHLRRLAFSSLFLLTLITVFFLIRAGYTGGSISHPEIHGHGWLPRLEAGPE